MKRKRQRPDPTSKMISIDRIMMWSFHLDELRKQLKTVKTYGIKSFELSYAIRCQMKTIADDMVKEVGAK